MSDTGQRSQFLRCFNLSLTKNSPRWWLKQCRVSEAITQPKCNIRSVANASHAEVSQDLTLLSPSLVDQMRLLAMLFQIILILNDLHPPGGDRPSTPRKLLQGFWTPATHPGTGANPWRWTGMPRTRCWKGLAVTLLSTTTVTRTENRRRLSWECCTWGRMWQSVSMVVATNNSEIYVTYSAEAFQWSMSWIPWEYSAEEPSNFFPQTSVNIISTVRCSILH